jgi:hypothetical protein
VTSPSVSGPPSLPSRGWTPLRVTDRDEPRLAAELCRFVVEHH